MKRILITGGSGFIGTNLIAFLLEKGYDILSIDVAEPQNKEHIVNWKRVDILDYSNFRSSVAEFSPSIIVHLAAVTDLNGEDLSYYAANTTGTKNLIDIAKEVSSIKKVIFTSSMYVCQPGYIPKDYDDYKPHTLYGESKREGEILVKNEKGFNFEWVIVRPTSIWGPWFSEPYIDFFNVVYERRYFNFSKICTKTYGYIGNTVHQFYSIISQDALHSKVFYLGDNPPIQISKWAEEISIEMGKGNIRNIPYYPLKLAAYIGDFLSRINIKFPITSFRLKNMMTNNILPLDDIYKVAGPSPVNRLEGVKRTIEWLIKFKHYRIDKIR